MLNRSILLLILLLPQVCQADWITEAYFSEKAGIDKIERFLVIPDVDSNQVFGHQILSLGDINGDNTPDILIGRPPGVFDSGSVFLFYGGTPPDAIYEKEFFGFDYRLAMIGDVSNDGYSDLGDYRFPGYIFELYLGGPDIDDSAVFTIPGIQTTITKAGDFDGDGELDIALGTSLNDNGLIKIYNIENNRDTIPEYIIEDTAKDFANNMVTLDFNGDGYTDIGVAAYLNRYDCFVRFYWGGPDFDTLPDFTIWRVGGEFWGEYLVPIPDFNGDGYDDLFIGGVGFSPYGVYFGGPDVDDQVDVIVTYGPWGYVPPYSIAPAGDVNNDGYQDLIISFIDDNAFHYEVRVYLGGPDVDSQYDIYMENEHVPGGQRYFGWAVAGIGDFNGDGIDDFAVTSRTSGGCCWMGEVNLFAGWQGAPVAADDQDNSANPLFELSQNYPNPFNAGTTIKFTLPRAGQTRIDICNALGELVATPVNRYFTAGLHQINWDGTDNNGRTVASGIYFYRISSGDYFQTKKMVLMK